MARVLMVASEAAPFAKTGGLADVLGSLPQALAGQGHEVAVLMPRYRQVHLDGCERIYHELPVYVGSTAYVCAIDRVRRGAAQYLFADCPALYDREGLYTHGGRDFADNPVRFATLSRCALEVARRIFRPQVVHCHDWQSALTPAYMRRTFASDPTFLGMRVLFTIHNLGYQGIFAPDVLPRIGFDRSMLTPSTLEFWGQVNFMKAGLIWSDAINTVSPTYAQEIQTPEHGFGLDGLLRSRSAVVSGILNGVDYGEWSPEVDRHIPAQYSASDLSGKAACKRRLLETLNIMPDGEDRPVLGIVSRFAVQKGFDLIAEVAGELMSQNISLAVLGSAASDDDARFERFFVELQKSYPGRVGLKIGYDNSLAHLIEAGSDIFLMPSLYEPCGLNQMYSLRYGTPPVVRATGGLNDTIDESVGFKFQGYAGRDFLTAVRAALEAYKNRERWRARMLRGMSLDFSWGVSARCYGELYSKLLEGQESGAAA